MVIVQPPSSIAYSNLKDLSKTSSYFYHLPEELIAQAPAQKRNESRLLCLNRKTQTITHHLFSDLVDLLPPQCLIVANNTKVMKARMRGYRLLPNPKVAGMFQRGGEIEVVLLRQHDVGRSRRVWEVLMGSSGKQRTGFEFEIPSLHPNLHGAAPPLRGRIIQGTDQPSALSAAGVIVVEFDQNPLEGHYGVLPLPHYIKTPTSENQEQAQEQQERDEDRYQTVFSKEQKEGGSAAAPTAGLHFTPDLIQTLVQKGMQWEELTLQVGLGTFRPVKVDEILQHPMHEEYFYISDSLAHLIEQSKNRKPIVAIGTTTTRALESAAGEEISSSLMIKRGNQSTSIFIHPLRPRFQVIDHLLTNFHLPQSTLLMLVCAFAGYDLTMRAYEEAVREKYRFFSYGDAMLIV